MYNRKETIVTSSPVQMPESIEALPQRDELAKDATIAWFRGEFAAANAIIDALCVHLRRLDPSATSRYESVFTAVHRRRLNWIPVIQNQRYFSIAEVTSEMNKVAEETINRRSDGEGKDGVEREKTEREKQSGPDGNDDDEERESVDMVDEDLSSDVTDTGSQEAQPLERMSLCSNHDECEGRLAHIKTTTGFVAKELVKGHMVNVVRGLKLYEDIFTELELSKLNDFVNELRIASQNNKLSGETYTLYNQQEKGNRRELIQLGIPIFRKIEEGDTNESLQGSIEPIPALLQAVVDHLFQWHLIPGNEKPNSCIINFFDEGEFSQPFLKPPHLEQTISTLLLSESTMAFGSMLARDGEGNYKAPLNLSLKKGSLLVMRGNSSSTAMHAMCTSSNRRVGINFFRVRTNDVISSDENPLSNTSMVNLWKPIVQSHYAIANKYDPTVMIQRWGGFMPVAPVLMLAPVVHHHQMVMTPPPPPHERAVQDRGVNGGGGGTGVFLPGSVGTSKPIRQLPPRSRR